MGIGEPVRGARRDVARPARCCRRARACAHCRYGPHGGAGAFVVLVANRADDVAVLVLDQHLTLAFAREREAACERFMPLRTNSDRLSSCVTKKLFLLARAIAACRRKSASTPISPCSMTRSSSAIAASIASMSSAVRRCAARKAASPSSAMRNSKQRMRSAISPEGASRKTSRSGRRSTTVPGTLARRHQRVGLQPRNGLADDRSRDPEHRAKLCFRRQPCSNRELAADDLLQKLLIDLVGQPDRTFQIVEGGSVLVLATASPQRFVIKNDRF